MMRPISLCLALLAGIQAVACAREAKLVRYPDYHDGKVAFAYLGDIWTADEDGKNIERLTVHTARDIHPRFSPDGRSIAFSSDREGNMDVYVIPDRRRGGQAPDDPLGRRDRARLDARRQERPLRQPARRRFHGQALRGLDRRRPAPRRRPRHGSRRLATRPTGPSWPSTARPRRTGASTTAAPTRAT